MGGVPQLRVHPTSDDGTDPSFALPGAFPENPPEVSAHLADDAARRAPALELNTHQHFSCGW